VAVEIVFEAHSLATDNRGGHGRGLVGWQLSERGRALATELGRRRRTDGIAVVVASDLGRAVETVQLGWLIRHSGPAGRLAACMRRRGLERLPPPDHRSGRHPTGSAIAVFGIPSAASSTIRARGAHPARTDDHLRRASSSRFHHAAPTPAQAIRSPPIVQAQQP
jgi:hypothetical protein